MATAKQTRTYWKENVLNYYDDQLNQSFKSGPWATCPILAINADPSLGHIFFDDFHYFTEADRWTTTEDEGKTGTDGVQDAVGGWYKNFCDADDNDESYCIAEGEFFKLVANKPLWFEAKVQLTEANTDEANWIVGLIENPGADTLLDNGGGPSASYDGFCFFKVDGTMKVQFESSTAATQVTNATLADFTSGTAVRVGAYFDGGTTITPYVDGVAGTAHTLNLTGQGELAPVFGVKAGGTNEEAIEIDYIKVVQVR
jgi:hypothetical protein